MNRASRKIVVELLTAVAVVVFLELVPSAGSLGQPAGSPGDVEEQVGQLIKQLGNESRQERERATRELVQLGAPALEALRRAMKDPDAEVALRARFPLGLSRPSLR